MNYVLPKRRGCKLYSACGYMCCHGNADSEGVPGLTDLDSTAPETQMQRTKRLGYRLDADKVFDQQRSDKPDQQTPAVAITRKSRPKLNVYIPQAERESVSSAKSSCNHCRQICSGCAFVVLLMCPCVAFLVQILTLDNPPPLPKIANIPILDNHHPNTG